MSQLKPEYSSLDEFTDMASQLVEKYPEVFGTLDIETIKCVAITNKERREGKKFYEVKPVPYPIRMDCEYAYYIIIYLNDWAEMDGKHRAVLVASALHAIPYEDDKEGKVNAPDLKDFGNLLRTFGVDYMDTEDIPDLINDQVEWVLR